MNSLRKIALLVALMSLLVQCAWLPGSVSAQENEGEDLQNSLVQELQGLTKGKVRISTHGKTGKVRFIGTELSNLIPQPAAPVEPIQVVPLGDPQPIQSPIGVTQLQPGQVETAAAVAQQVPPAEKHAAPVENSGPTLDQLIETKQSVTSPVISEQLPATPENPPAVQPLIEKSGKGKKSKTGTTLLLIVLFIVIGVALLLLGLYLSPNLNL